MPPRESGHDIALVDAAGDAVAARQRTFTSSNIMSQEFKG
jgi:hypothetical protein